MYIKYFKHNNLTNYTKLKEADREKQRFFELTRSGLGQISAKIRLNPNVYLFLKKESGRIRIRIFF